MFGPGGSTGRLRAFSFLGTRGALLCEEVFVRALDEATAFFSRWMTRSHQLTGEVQANHLRCTYCGRSLFPRSQAGLKISCRQQRHEAILAMGWTGVRERHGARSLMARNSTECLLASAIWSLVDPRFPGHRQHGQHILQHLLQVWYYADFKGVV